MMQMTTGTVGGLSDISISNPGVWVKPAPGADQGTTLSCCPLAHRGSGAVKGRERVTPRAPMATQNLTPHPTGPSTPEAFIADRQIFWTRFTHFIVLAVIGVVILLIGMAIFLT